MKYLILAFSLLLTQSAMAGGTPCMFKPGGCSGDEYGHTNSVLLKTSSDVSAIRLNDIFPVKAGGACCSWGPIKNCFPGC